MAESLLAAPERQEGGAEYSAEEQVGTSFLSLPARASRDGDDGEAAVGTAVHCELACALGGGPPFICVAFEPATGDVLVAPAPAGSTGFQVYEEVVWSVMAAYMEKAGPQVAYKPSNITTTDSGLADYMFGLLQGCGCDVMCVDGATQRVQWPATRLARLVPGGAIGEHAPLVREVTEALLEELVSSGRARELLGDGAGAPPTGLVLAGSCHDGECGKLAPRRGLKRCSACKRTTYCSAACQARHWKAGHRVKCKDIQAINAPLTELGRDGGAGASLEP